MDLADDEKVLELEELVLHPGTYFNPQTEVVVIVDDSTSIDQEVFDRDAHEAAEWVQISDEVPVDTHALEQAVESFHTRYHPGVASTASATALEQTDDDVAEIEVGPEPDPEEENEE